MGELENKAQKRARLGKIQKAILVSLSIGGMLTMAALAPNTLKLLGWGKRRKSKYDARDRYAVKRSLKKLEERGFIEWKEENGKRFFDITPDGEKLLRKIDPEQYYRLAFGKQKRRKWDRKWRIVIFDIPEKKRHLRDGIRSTLEAMGFYILQESVWVYPYSCEDYITLLKADFGIGKHLLYLIVEEVENDAKLREHFDLKT